LKFEQYVTTRGQELLRLAYVLTGDPHRAEDVVQTVLIDVMRKWDRIESTRDPHSYIRRMVVNAHLDWHRRRSSTEVPVAQWPSDVQVQRDPADGIALRDQLRVILAELPPRARTVLVLRYYLDLDDEAISETLGISASAVRSTAARALSRLRLDQSIQIGRDLHDSG
jgi:RNA polymerase sigma-70 factor (sigma-E family)